LSTARQDFLRIAQLGELETPAGSKKHT